MALEIKENRGLFEIHGRVTSQNLGALQVYIDSIIEASETIVISLENVVVLDSAAALFFEKLYREVAAQNKVLSIVGTQNDEISEIMNLTNTGYILSSDRV